jgi:hypothetical protein
MVSLASWNKVWVLGENNPRVAPAEKPHAIAKVAGFSGRSYGSHKRVYDRVLPETAPCSTWEQGMS